MISLRGAPLEENLRTLAEDVPDNETSDSSDPEQLEQQLLLSLPLLLAVISVPMLLSESELDSKAGCILSDSLLQSHFGGSQFIKKS